MALQLTISITVMLKTTSNYCRTVPLLKEICSFESFLKEVEEALNSLVFTPNVLNFCVKKLQLKLEPFVYVNINVFVFESDQID